LVELERIVCVGGESSGTGIDLDCDDGEDEGELEEEFREGDKSLFVVTSRTLEMTGEPGGLEPLPLGEIVLPSGEETLILGVEDG
jgi:hypothetical protein